MSTLKDKYVSNDGDANRGRQRSGILAASKVRESLELSSELSDGMKDVGSEVAGRLLGNFICLKMLAELQSAAPEFTIQFGFGGGDRVDPDDNLVNRFSRNIFISPPSPGEIVSGGRERAAYIGRSIRDVVRAAAIIMYESSPDCAPLRIYDANLDKQHHINNELVKFREREAAALLAQIEVREAIIADSGFDIGVRGERQNAEAYIEFYNRSVADAIRKKDKENLLTDEFLSDVREFFIEKAGEALMYELVPGSDATYRQLFLKSAEEAYDCEMAREKASNELSHGSIDTEFTVEVVDREQYNSITRSRGEELAPEPDVGLRRK